MKDSLDHTLNALREAPVALPGSDFNRLVWKEIESRRPQATGSWLHLWQRPALMAAGLLLAALGGTTMAYAQLRTSPATRIALGLDVFSAEPKHLPSGLLARSK